MTFTDLCNRHQGRTVTICGTGPSLDKLDHATLTGPRIFINRAAFVLPASPGETYWLVIDDAWGLGVTGPWQKHLELVRAGEAGMVGVFRDPLLAGGHCVPVPAGPNVIGFRVMRGRQREMALELSRQHVAESGELFERVGSAATAVHLAWYLGADSIRMIGIDGGVGVAGGVRGHYAEAETLCDYSTPRRYALKAAEILGLEVSFR